RAARPLRGGGREAARRHRHDAAARGRGASPAAYRPRLAHRHRQVRDRAPQDARRGGGGALMHFVAPAWLLLLIVIAAVAGVYLEVQMRRKKYVARFRNGVCLASVAPRRPGWRGPRTLARRLVGL